MYNAKKLSYKFAVKNYYIKDCYVNGSEFTTKGMINMARDIIYYIDAKTRVQILNWPFFKDMQPVVILEGSNKGRVAFVESNEVVKEYQ